MRKNYSILFYEVMCKTVHERFTVDTRRRRRLAVQFLIINLVSAANELIFLESAIIHFWARCADFRI